MFRVAAYRVTAIVGASLALASCTSTPDWLSEFKPGPVLDTVRFESDPPGAEAKTSNGQSCRTPCALALPAEQPMSVTFTLTGYLPDTESLEPVAATGSPPSLQPNPVMAELEQAPPPPKPAKPVKKKPVVKKKKPAPKPTAAAKPVAPTPAPTTAAPAQQPASPWPTPPSPPAQR